MAQLYTNSPWTAVLLIHCSSWGSGSQYPPSRHTLTPDAARTKSEQHWNVTLSPRIAGRFVQLLLLMCNARSYFPSNSSTMRDLHVTVKVQHCSLISPTLEEGKGLVYIEHFLRRTGCSMSCDCHDNTSFRHNNASTTLTRSNSWVQCNIT